MRAVAWLCLIASVGVAVSGLFSGKQTRATNQRRDQQDAPNRRAVAAARQDDPLFPRQAESNDIYALRNLLQNGALDCELLRAAETSLTPHADSDISTSAGRIEELETRLCAAR